MNILGVLAIFGPVTLSFIMSLFLSVCRSVVIPYGKPRLLLDGFS